MINQSVIFLFILSTLLVPRIESYNILVIFPHQGGSHFQSFVGLFTTLAAKGHNMTVIGHFPPPETIPNYRHITIGGLKEFLKVSPISKFLNISNLDPDSKIRRHFMFLILAEVGKKACEMGFSSEEVWNFLKEHNHFDLAVIEYFNSDCFLALAKMLNVPVVRVLSSSLMPWSSNRFGNPNNPAYIPSHFMPFSDRMTFLQRVENTYLNILHCFYFNFHVLMNNDKRIAVKYFGEFGASLDSDIFKDSLLLVNSHYTVTLPRPMVPNIVEVAGIHLVERKDLPKDIEKWINESKHGVIYFSFGSLVKGHTMPAEKRQAFINAFKRLPQRVIWKWENETMEGKTDNILIGKWMPQFDILSHPNVKAFISHGGLLGTFEAVHCGVPVLVMPQFGDQHTNAKAIESVGGGEILYLSDATEEKIYTALKKILSPSFQEQAKELSERFRDRPMSPLDTAIYWVEYVARHKGAHFMKTAAVGMPFYQYYLLDVIGFILAVLIIFLYVSYLILRFLFRLVFKPKHSSSKKVKKS